jgi:hypothetical protein
MLTLEKIMSELKVSSVNEVVGGKHGKTTKKTKKTKTHKHKSHVNYY